jgi:hypothetical protein
LDADVHVTPDAQLAIAVQAAQVVALKVSVPEQKPVWYCPAAHVLQAAQTAFCVAEQGVPRYCPAGHAVLHALHEVCPVWS